MARLRMGIVVIPNVGHHIFETRNPYPKKFELERARHPGPPIIGKQKGTMVRQGGGEDVEHM
jgi:hypothetical protein